MRKFALASALGSPLALLAGMGQAQPPAMPNLGSSPSSGSGLNNLVQPAAAAEDINAAYAVTPEAGAWMICASSYVGPDAPELANKLCEFLRGHRYPAYIYNRGNEERRKFQEELDQWQRENPGLRRRRLANMQEEQLAVLVGGFRDAAAAGAELKKLCKLEVPLMKLQSGKPAFDTFNVYEKTPGGKGYELKRYPISPFRNAIAVPNPTVPHQARAAHKSDPIWRKLNADEPFSVFKCPKPWTLAVQEYAGSQVIQPTSASGGSFLDKFGLGDRDLGRRLDASAQQAQQVCGLLRKLNYKAYVLHTRNSSVVTVGEFNSKDDPELLRLQEQLATLKFRDKLGNDIVKLFARPLPMEVPH